MKEWQTTKLGDISQIYSGFAFRSQDLGEHGIPVVKIGNIQNKRVSPECADHLPEELCIEKLSRYFLQQGDTLIAMTGAGSVGKVGKMPRVDGRFLVNQRVAIVRPDDSRCDSAFVYFAVSQDVYETKLYALGLGAGQPIVSAKEIGDLEIPFPPLPVQRRIAGILSAYDELMENSQRRIRLLEAMARALYREWFVHFRFPGHEKLPRVASPLGDIPQGWEVKPFSAIASYVNGHPFKPAQLGTEGKPIIKIKELKAGIVADTPRNPGDDIPEKYNIHDGDVLFSWSADLDTYLWMGGEGLLNQHLFNVVPFDGISRAFCFHALKASMPRFRSLSLGATMHHIKRSALDQVFTLLPTAALRKRFEALVEPMHQQLITLTKHAENLHRTRDLLLPRLLSGQVQLKTEAA